VVPSVVQGRYWALTYARVGVFGLDRVRRPFGGKLVLLVFVAAELHGSPACPMRSHHEGWAVSLVFCGGHRWVGYVACHRCSVTSRVALMSLLSIRICSGWKRQGWLGRLSPVCVSSREQSRGLGERLGLLRVPGSSVE
jgi:hypothetical protein